MSDTMSLYRLRKTPLGDLLRGRVTGRLDYAGAIARANLGAPISALITRVVKRTRLYRCERSDLANELIAHFADGLASGTSAEQLIRDFGDERAAAKLIRRAKIRNRPLPWHVTRFLLRGFVGLGVVYAVLVGRFMLGAPNVSVDYLAQLNAPVRQVPQADRAWPLYREAILALGLGKEGKDETLDERIGSADDEQRTLLEATPADAEWPKLAAWLDAHQRGLQLFREASAMPALGFELGPDGPAYDAVVGFPEKPNGLMLSTGPSVLDDSLITVLLPHLNPARAMAMRISADMRYARQQGDAARVVADLEAMDGFARQLRESDTLVITRLVGIGIHSLMLRDLQETLIQTPALLSDAQLVRLAHRLDPIAGDNAASFFDLAGERMMVLDILQRLYTDNGNGDGRFTPEGLKSISLLMGLIGSQSSGPDVGMLLVGSALNTVNTRRDVQNELTRLCDMVETALAKPAYELDPERNGHALVQRRLDEIRASSVEHARLFLVTMLMPTFANAQFTAERVIAIRDATQVAIALEIYRRRNNAYPQTLDQLVPGMLPRVPRDRITGGPLRFGVIDGKPVLYSVGVDRDDDGGRRPLSPNARADVWHIEPASAGSTGVRRWNATTPAREADGDWVVFPSERPRETPTTMPAK